MKLSEKYESNGNPGCISDGWGDAGGKSYGMYQFASNCGVVDAFIDWLIEKSHWMGKYLDGYRQYQDLDSGWQELGKNNADEFAELQTEYVKSVYYDEAVANLEQADFHIYNHSETMQEVVWSRAVQYGAGQIVEMFEEACQSLGYPNLSYVDAKIFDKEMIQAIYLTVCSSIEWTNGSPLLREGLYNRFENECADALAMLAQE